MNYNFIKTFILTLSIGSLLVACQTEKSTPQEESILSYVDPYIGSGGHGHVFVGASLPFGGVQAGPSNINKGWDWTSAYHYTDSIVKGFAQLHLSGTGISDLSDILTMPAVGPLQVNVGTQANPELGYASKYSHDNEIVEPGYYSLLLDAYDITTEITTTQRAVIYRYNYPQANDARLIVDLGEGNCETPTDTYFKQLNDSIVVGYRYSTGWAVDQREYFALQLSKPIESVLVYNGDLKQDATEARGKEIKAFLQFKTTKGEIVKSKVAISPVSTEKALANLNAEIPHWDFDKVREANQSQWKEELAKIEIKTDDMRQKTIFYTALYHSMMAPSLYNDTDGAYRGMDGKIHDYEGFQNYSILSLWDTYRAAHPLFTITQPDLVPDMVNTMLAIYQQQGKLPIWHLRGNETNTMVGYSAVPIVVDAVLKGIPGIDINLAYEAVYNSAFKELEPGIAEQNKYGYIPGDLVVEAVARSMEYAISDWAIAQLATKLGKTEDAAYFTKRAMVYKEYFDETDQFMKGKMVDGSFRTPFNPIKAEHRTNDYCEGNAWQYIWLVPQDPEGLIGLFGGDKPFTTKLDELFSMSSELGEEASADITGLIGQYAHGNEPSHHTTYLYAYAGEQYKTADKVRFIMDSLYTDQPNGLSGNEDCGQMSAWYIMSSLGFYSVNPANGAYVFGSPLFDEASISLPANKKFTIVANNNSAENIYIQSVTLNGAAYTKSFITHKDIMNGGVVTFEMGNTPNKDFGKAAADRPQSIVY